MKHEQRFLWLDLIRGFSALVVCSGHLRSVTLVDFPDIEGQINVFQKAFYFVTGLGHQAVMIFVTTQAANAKRKVSKGFLF